MTGSHKAILETVTEQDLRLLRIFRAIALSGGLTAAESRLGMERSTISRHLQALENRLGGALCVRGPAGFDLTELGRSALKAAITVEDMLAQVRDALNPSERPVHGELTLGIVDNTISNPHSHLVELLEDYRSKAPDVRLHLSVKTHAESIADLKAGNSHLAIVGPVHGIERLQRQMLFSESFKLYAPDVAGWTPTLDQLLDLRFDLVTRDGEHRSLALAKKLGIERKIVATGLEGVAMLIASGNCFGYLPTHMVAALPLPRKLVEVRCDSSLAYVAEYVLVRDGARPLTRPAELFLQLASAVFPTEHHWFSAPAENARTANGNAYENH